MPRQLFINLPVANLEESLQFYLALGFTVQPLFTDTNQKCMAWSDDIYVMLQSTEFAGSFIKKPFGDARTHQTASHTLPVENIDLVNEIIERGLKVGGLEPVPAVKEPFLYLRSIEDPDGFVWGVLYLDIEQFRSLKQG